MPSSSQHDRTVARATYLGPKEIKRKGDTLKKFSRIMKILAAIIDALDKIVRILKFFF